MISAALVFALRHLPILYAVVGSPPVWLVSFAIAVNLLAGTAVDYLYWPAGLEATIMAYALSHAVGLLTAASLP